MRPRLLGSRRRLYAIVACAALLAAGLLIALGLISANRGTTAAPQTAAVTGAAEVDALLAGIPQRGNLLGSPNAPVRLVEYSDIQCPYCARFSVTVLPSLVREYVRPGDVRVEFRGLAFLGPGSVTALRTATAAGRERRMWNVVELLFVNQGAENAWVTDDLLRSITTAAGADADRVLAERDGIGVRTAIDGWARSATAGNVTAVPTFFVGRRGGPLERLTLSSLGPAEFRAALDRALGR